MPARAKGALLELQAGIRSSLLAMASSCKSGAWISLNPLKADIKGKAPSDDDVASFRYTLIEADELSMAEQWECICKLHLPIKSVVWSGGKSLHTIVKIDAGTDRELFKQRVKALHGYLEKKGFPFDHVNKNPSRLTRLPGFFRGSELQYLVADEFGPATWEVFEQLYLKSSDAINLLPDIEKDLQFLVDGYGEPFGFNEKGDLSYVNQPFFAGYTVWKTGLKCDHLGRWRLYNSDTGLWEVVPETALLGLISRELLDFSRKYDVPALAAKRSARQCQDIKAFMNSGREESTVFNTAQENTIHTGNCMVEVLPDGNLKTLPFSPDFYSCRRTTVPYDPEAQCPIFQEKLLAPCMDADDIECLQLYFGQCLLGRNRSQMFLMLTGTAQSGKSTLVNIIEAIIGRENCTELRLEHMSGRFEANRLIGKSLLTAKDVKSDFLTTKGAYKIKALTGKDTIST